MNPEPHRWECAAGGMLWYLTDWSVFPADHSSQWGVRGSKSKHLSSCPDLLSFTNCIMRAHYTCLAWQQVLGDEE